MEIINHVKEHNYLGVMINYGNYEVKINNRTDKGRTAVYKINVLWDRNVTLQVKNSIYHALSKSTVTYTEDI